MQRPESDTSTHRSTDDISTVHTLFEQPWWLEAVAPGRWGEVVVRRGDEVAARLPYVVRTGFGLTSLTHAPLTRSLGPWLRPATGKYPHRLAVETELMTELVAGLPPCDAFRASFAPDVSNWLPFHWAGFDATVRYTYRIDDLSDLDAVWANFVSSTRGHVRRAERDLETRSDLDLDQVLEVNRETFRRQHLPVPFDDGYARRLDRACAARGARTILGAVDRTGRVHAACYVVHDRRRSYLLYGGGDPALRSSNATSLLVWEAIKQASAAGRGLDFLGSMMKPLEQRNRSFGATQVPYLLVSRTRPRMRAALATRGVVERGRADLPRLLRGLRTRPRPAPDG